jgi:hypothetical protein
VRLGREPSDASTCEAVGEQGGEVEDPSLGEQIFRDAVEAGGHAGGQYELRGAGRRTAPPVDLLA